MTPITSLREEAEPSPTAVPLTEQLRSIPRDAVLRIDTPNALGCMDTRSIPVGRLCHEAANAIALSHPEYRSSGERGEAALNQDNWPSAALDEAKAAAGVGIPAEGQPE